MNRCVGELICADRNLPIVPVVLDPILVRRLRPHQIEGQWPILCQLSSPWSDNSIGVKFLYEATMGLRKHEGQGCILADEMCAFTLP